MSKIENIKFEEALIAEAIIDARKVQEFLWNDRSMQHDKEFNVKRWLALFQKRINKIAEIDERHPNAEVELRKRILQQTALGIVALKVLSKNNEHEY